MPEQTSELNPYIADIAANAASIEATLRDLEALVAEGTSRRAALSRVLAHDEAVASARLYQEAIDTAVARCHNVTHMAGRLRDADIAEADALVSAFVSEMLRQAEERGQRTICIMAPPAFRYDAAAEGFLRRIQLIDTLIPGDLYRVYVHRNEQLLSPCVERIDDMHLLLTYGTATTVATTFARLCERAATLYCHSMLCYDEELMEYADDTPLVFEMHGIPPEEAAYGMNTTGDVCALNRRERAVTARASVVVTVTRNMERHLRDKYPQETEDTRFVHLPTVSDAHIHRRADGADGMRPVVIYAGGLQPWQLTDEMFDAMAAQGDLCDYRVFLPASSTFEEAWGTRPLPASLVTGTRTKAELDQEYRTCDFGFALRDDNVVNRVACPTKITEYLAYGIVPILREADIGDFGRLGIAYVPLDAFRRGELPGHKERQTMVAANHQLMRTLISEFEAGTDELVRFLS